MVARRLTADALPPGRDALRAVADRLSCTSAARAPRSSTGSTPATPAARFLLRIEDTDRARSTPEATAAIFEGLRWLGLDWDGEAISQFERAPRHAEVAHEMVARGTAYRCWSTVEEIEAFREQARGRGPPAALPLALARRRPRDRPRRALRRPPARPARRRDRGRGRRAGQRHLEERDPRRPDPAALRRHAHLHARGGGRRPRHGRHPRHPRRRPPDQRRPPDADLPGDGLGRRRSSPTSR